MVAENSKVPRAELPHFPPNIGEPIAQALRQIETPIGMLVGITYVGPGRTFDCVAQPEDVEKWANLMLHYSKMSKAGLHIE